MNHHKLEKHLQLYRQQYEDFMMQLYGSYKIDRASMDLDAIMFRIKYMKNHNKDLDKLNVFRNKFEEQAYYTRNLFINLIYNFISKIIGNSQPIKDIFITDIKMDQNYIDFDLQIISEDKEYLEWLDKKISDNETFNMFPDKYFRFNTDSYNDGIAKAYPELFENREQNVVGTGDDKDIFVHSMTFQSGERCSLSCSYCLSGDSLIQTPNGYPTRIKNLKEGDLVYGFDENTYLKSDFNGMVHHALKEVKVIKTYKHEAEVWELKSPYILYTLKITPNHKILTIDGWKELKHIKPGTMLGFRKGQNIIFSSNYQIYKSNSKIDVYNIATESGTYIANGLCVHNCYQFAKSEMRMSFGTAKEFIDHLLNDDYGYINRYNSPAIILEFIGGEPLLEIKLTRKIYEYFLERCYELNHPWFTMHRLSICSNGLQYFDKEVQDFFEEYSSQISFNISIDGNKELHDACRVQPNGEGSYDIDMMALNHYNKYYTAERNSKMTLAPSNISYLFDSVVDFIKHGMSVININCVFEEGWEPSHALIEYEQLKKLADYILENDLEHIYVAIFNERQEDMMNKHSDNTACGGSSASMLSIRPNGEFYPCIRYMPTSVGLNRRNMSMGTVSTGMIERSDKSEVIRDLDHTTRRGYSTDICFECPLSNDCMNCGALSVTVFNSVNRRTTFACIMMIAEHLANVYYWNAMILKHPEWDLHVRRIVVPDEWALLVIDKDELDFLKKLETLAMMNVMER